jgi:hypothetical protein
MRKWKWEIKKLELQRKEMGILESLVRKLSSALEFSLERFYNLKLLLTNERESPFYRLIQETKRT